MQTVIIDLDDNTVTVNKEEPLPEPPEEAMNMLRETLGRVLFPELEQLSDIRSRKASKKDREEMEARKENQIRLCFLAYFVCLLKDIPKFINAELENTDDVFDIDNYLSTQVHEAEVCGRVFFLLEWMRFILPFLSSVADCPLPGG